ncbi:MAG: aminoacyl-tRNA hydrolase [Phycisphaerales bacterium]|nr:aminoacyl-tRNA hydrolase [Phycisphaerales bacterium]
MKVIVGLGNPGPAYQNTRHNVGFMAIDRLAQRLAPGAPLRSQFQAAVTETRAGADKCLLVKPMTYMNLSGATVAEIVRFYKMDPADLLVITDDVALPLGDIRLRKSGSDGGHNGLADITRRLGTEAFPRLRVGIDPPGRIARHDYVLGRFTPEQAPVIEERLGVIADAAWCWANEGIDTAMNRFNTRKARKDDSQEQED